MALKINIHIGRLAHHSRWCNAFADGLRAHGIMPDIIMGQEPGDCDLAVFWGHRFNKVITAQKSAGRHYLVLENAYLGERTTIWASAGFNGLNGYADFVNDQSPADRYEKYFPGSLLPWRSEGEYIAIMGQVPGDQSLRGMDIYAWAAETARSIEAGLHTRPRFCPHPFARFRTPPGMDIVMTRQEVFEHAKAVVTYNSNSAVDAVLAGIPAIVCDRGGMAWPIASHSVGDRLERPDRYQWVCNLAYAQWNEDEFRKGDAWEHLKRKYERQHQMAS